jgi:hypothetical protein
VNSQDAFAINAVVVSSIFSVAVVVELFSSLKVMFVCGELTSVVSTGIAVEFFVSTFKIESSSFDTFATVVGLKIVELYSTIVSLE